uniref:Endo/exonuclease/phosphatase domain-containing protein n=1 Tax=Angiostrongylus cantonensis TaxID=6313 RepID=A0A0K0DNE7_ANGCA
MVWSFVNISGSLWLYFIILSVIQCVLWMGDLNFRITKDSGIQWNSHPHGLSSSDIENIIKSDELAIIRKKELAFTAFSEAPIKFAPTYKFEIGTNNYVADRIPSYTDRILFWTKQTSWLECTSYNSIHKESQSDHRPVYATFQARTIVEIPKQQRYPYFLKTEKTCSLS